MVPLAMGFMQMCGLFGWCDLPFNAANMIVLPVILGLLIPPKPLGAAAMSNREISVGLVTSTTAPKTNQTKKRKKHRNKKKTH